MNLGGELGDHCPWFVRGFWWVPGRLSVNLIEVNLIEVNLIEVNLIDRGTVRKLSSVTLRQRNFELVARCS